MNLDEERTGELSPRRRRGHREKKIDNLCELCVSAVQICFGFGASDFGFDSGLIGTGTNVVGVVLLNI